MNILLYNNLNFIRYIVHIPSRFQTWTPENDRSIGCRLFPDFSFNIWRTQQEILWVCSQQDNVRSVLVRGGVWVERVGGRTWCANSAAEIKCFCLQHIHTCICPHRQKLSDLIDFLSWHYRRFLLFTWDICIVLCGHRVFITFSTWIISCCVLTWAHSYSLWSF